MKRSDWDIDFSRGQWGESVLQDVILTTEVKTDYGWIKTGNLYIETECYYLTHDEFRPSGLSISKASYYSFVLPKKDEQPLVISVPTDLLKEVVKTKGRKIACTWSDNPSKGYLIKVSDLMFAYMGKI